MSMMLIKSITSLNIFLQYNIFFLYSYSFFLGDRVKGKENKQRLSSCQQKRPLFWKKICVSIEFQIGGPFYSRELIRL